MRSDCCLKGSDRTTRPCSSGITARVVVVAATVTSRGMTTVLVELFQGFHVKRNLSLCLTWLLQHFALQSSRFRLQMNVKSRISQRFHIWFFMLVFLIGSEDIFSQPPNRLLHHVVRSEYLMTMHNCIIYFEMTNMFFPDVAKVMLCNEYTTFKHYFSSVWWNKWRIFNFSILLQINSETWAMRPGLAPNSRCGQQLKWVVMLLN